MKSSIKAKILISTSLVVIVSLLISGSLAYSYFVNILREQVIKDDSARLNQTRMHLEYIIDDIEKFSYNIAFDSDIQEYLNVKTWKSYLDQLWCKDNARSKLKNYRNLREYIQSIAIIRNDGTACANDSAFDEYTEENISGDWFQNYKRKMTRNYFSDPHVIQTDRSGVENVISYVIAVKNIDDPQIQTGYLILNIYMDQFNKTIKPESDGFEAYLWYGQDNTVFYKKKALNYSIKPEILSKQDAENTTHDSYIVKQSNGYVIFTNKMSNGWQLAAYTMNSTLLKKTNYILYIFIIFIFASLLLIILIILPIVLGITRPITKLTKAMSKVSGGNMDINLDITSGDEIQILGDGFNKMIRELKSYIAESIELQKTKRNMEFNLLLAQINPHFIYNTLNTVIYLAKKQNNDDIAQMTDSFIRILQDAVKIGEQGISATFRQEMDVVKHYVNIQQYRYPGRFSITWDVGEEMLDAWIPKTILQPLVENALIHGIFPSDRMGEIRITATKDEETLILEVYDNGIGMDEPTITSLKNRSIIIGNRSMRNIGIPNIIDRIDFLYGKDYGLNIESCSGEWTKIIVRIPYSQNPKDNIKN